MMFEGRTDGEEDEALREATLRNAHAILQAREQAERALLNAKQELEDSNRQITELLAREREARREAETLYEVARSLAGELDVQKLVQQATDAATQLTGAKFGAFFYNVTDEHGQSLLLYTLSGAPREAFEKFGTPRRTEIFTRTFDGAGIVRSDDIQKHPDYGKNAPHHGMPQGHLPVRSYLAVPVRSRSGQVLGGLFFGHPEPGIFTERAERIAVGIAAQAAIAIDNARLFAQAEHEIADRRQAVEEAVRARAVIAQSEERFRSLVLVITDVPWVADARGEFITPQPAWEAFTGQSWEEHRGFGWADAIHPEDRDRVKALWAAACLNRTLYESDGRLWHAPTKQWRYFTARATALSNPDGSTREWVGTCTDIHEKKKAEEALRESETRFRQLADSMPQIVWTARPDGCVDYYNERWYEYTGFPRGRFGQSSWEPILHPDDLQRCIDTYYGCIREGKPYHIEYRFRDRTQGGYRWFMGRALPIKNEQGQIVRWFGTCTDIENQKRAEERLEQIVAERTADLRATNKQLETFVYSIAHDLRAPLRAMQGFSSMLVEEVGSGLSETARDYAERINRSAQFMDALLRDLLAFSRISQQRVELSPVPLEGIMDSVRSRLQKDIKEKQASVECPGPWPVVMGHEATLAQVLFNLVSNALKFVGPETFPQVCLRTELRDSFVRVWVEDNGLGITPDHQTQIFQLFTRLHGERFPGTGIGLAIVQEGIERMGGRVGVESKPGQGSRFWFELRQA